MMPALAAIHRLRGPLYYVAGREMLVDAGINVDDITTEEFVGYQAV